MLTSIGGSHRSRQQIILDRKTILILPSSLHVVGRLLSLLDLVADNSGL